LDFDFFTTSSGNGGGGVGVSPTLSSSQCTIAAAASAAPFAHAIGQNATHEEEETNYYYVPQPINDVTTTTTITGNADVVVVVDHHLRRILSNSRVPKRSRDVVATGSAPARLAVPLPEVERAQLPGDDSEYYRRKFLAIAPAPESPLASGSGSGSGSSTPTPTPTSTPLPVPVSAPSTPAPVKPRRANRRRAAGSSSSSTTTTRRTKRFPCEYNCGKTFSRLQDQQRHSVSACDASPTRATVVCPECRSVLSRLDAAQRHWRGHENPTCAAPDWVSSRV